jgi:hypothetical protein
VILLLHVRVLRAWPIAGTGYDALVKINKLESVDGSISDVALKIAKDADFL